MSRRASSAVVAALSVILQICVPATFAAGVVSALGVVATSPAAAVGTYDNASIADVALGYVGRWGGAACVDAGKSGSTGGTPLGDSNNYDGECKAFVNCIVRMASGGSQWPAPGYAAGFLKHGVEVSEGAATKGDIIQWGEGEHTAIVVSNLGAGRFDVVDSNSVATHKVGHHVLNNVHMGGYSAPRFFRLGTVMGPQPSVNDPVGSLDDLGGMSRDTIRLRGWALDRDVPTAPIGLHAYIDGPAGSGSRGVDLGLAQMPRPDVAQAFPGVGANHGFDKTIGGVSPGQHVVYLYGINLGNGQNVLLRQLTVTVPPTATGSPIGNGESAVGLPAGAVRVVGWALDPDEKTASTNVHVYLDGPAGSGARGVDIGRAGLSRPDVAAAFPGAGRPHGFDAVIRGVTPGWHTAYMYAINRAGGGENPLVGQRQFFVPAGDPIGSFDQVQAVAPGAVRVRGWVLDPDNPALASAVHIYADGPAGTGRFLGSATGNFSRADVNDAYPTAGTRHGYEVALGGLTPGQHSIYVYGINASGAGINPLLGTRNVTVGGAAPGSPIGALDVVVGGPANVRVAGWTIDTNAQTTPTQVHVYIDGPPNEGVGFNIGLAGRSRPDVAAAYPGAGAGHGYDVTLHDIQPGRHSVFVYAINSGGSGDNTLIGFGSVGVARDAVAPSVRMTRPTRPSTKKLRVPVAWRAHDSGAGIANYQVRYRFKNRGVPTWSRYRSPGAWQRRTDTAVRSPRLTVNATFCFSVRATDRDGNRSKWTSARCVRRIS